MPSTVGIYNAADAIPEIAKAFHSVAKIYEAFRPGYPAECAQLLQSELKISENTRVLDLAAGTGKVSRMLLPMCGVEQLVAVEPLDGMRAELQRALPNVTALPGTAENIPLPDSSVDVVVVGDAFHWFKPEALFEIHRVLKSGGRLCMQWNDPDVATGAHFMKMLFFKVVGSRKPAGTPTYWDNLWRVPFSQSCLFTPLEMRRIKHTTAMSPEQMVMFVDSLSWIAYLSEEERRLVAEEVRAEIASDPYSAGKQVIDVPYNTDIYWCTKL